MDIQKELNRFYEMVKDMHQGEYSVHKDYKQYLALFENPAFQLFTGSTFQMMSVYDFFTHEYVFVSDSITQLAGRSKSDFRNKEGVLAVLEMLSPYSNELMLNYFTPVMIEHCQKNAGKIPNLRFSACVEINAPDPKFKWALFHNYIVCATPDGMPMLSCTLITDVSSIKKDNSLSFTAHLFTDGKAELLHHKIFSQQPSQLDLSKREMEIMQLLSTGKTSKEIAEQLFISYETVKSHRKNILEKTNCSSTVELINVATTLGII